MMGSTCHFVCSWMCSFPKGSGNSQDPGYFMPAKDMKPTLWSAPSLSLRIGRFETETGFASALGCSLPKCFRENCREYQQRRKFGCWANQCRHLFPVFLPESIQKLSGIRVVQSLLENSWFCEWCYCLMLFVVMCICVCMFNPSLKICSHVYPSTQAYRDVYLFVCLLYCLVVCFLLLCLLCLFCCV